MTFLEQLDRWHEDDEHEKIVDAILALPPEGRGYDLTGRLARALNNLSREAEGLARGEAEAALCANACLLARALERGGQPVFADGGAALAGLSAREIGALAGRWAAFDRAENPSPEDGEERLEGLKKAWSTRPMSAFAGACSNALARFRRRSGPNR